MKSAVSVMATMALCLLSLLIMATACSGDKEVGPSRSLPTTSSVQIRDLETLLAALTLCEIDLQALMLTEIHSDRLVSRLLKIARADESLIDDLDRKMKADPAMKSFSSLNSSSSYLMLQYAKLMKVACPDQEITTLALANGGFSSIVAEHHMLRLRPSGDAFGPLGAIEPVAPLGQLVKQYGYRDSSEFGEQVMRDEEDGMFLLNSGGSRPIRRMAE